MALPSNNLAGGSRANLGLYRHRSQRYNSDPTSLNIGSMSKNPPSAHLRVGEDDYDAPMRDGGGRTRTIGRQARLFAMILLGLTVSLAFQLFGQDLRSAFIISLCAHCSLHFSMRTATTEAPGLPLLTANSDGVRPCSYEQLYNAYGTPAALNATVDKGSTEKSSPGACWNLKDEILRIDANSILDRDNMLRLGGGKMGAENASLRSRATYAMSSKMGIVHRAVLDLPGSGGKCAVAIKSDICNVNPIESAFHRSNVEVSCLHRNASLMSNSSTLGAEYAAGLVFHVAKQAYARSPDLGGETPDVLDGIIPVWGVVEDTARPLPSRKPRHRLARTPLVSEPAVRGVVMPFMEEFVPFGSLSSSSMVTFASPGAGAVAQALLPAARSLAFVEAMGAALGDVLMKNIGLSSGRIVLFDYSKFTLLGGSTGRRCKLDSQWACEFCPDVAFPMSLPDQKSKYFQFEGFNTTMSMKDVIGFKGIALQLLKHCSPNKERKELIRGLSSAEDMNAVVELLDRLGGPNVSSMI